MTLLSLDSLTLTATRPSTLIRAANAAGFDLVSLWLQLPPIYLADLLPHALRDVPWAMGAPSLKRAAAGVTVAQQAKEAMASLRRVLAAVH